MKKSLIALAIVGAFSAQSAMADSTTIYGAANVSFDAVNNGNTANGASANGLSSNASKIGFKGSEALGDGLTAVWQLEEGINFANSGEPSPVTGGNGSANNTAPGGVYATGSNLYSRDTFVGLSSGTMGTLIAGIHDTPYKMATRGMDVFADTIADNRSIMGTSGMGVAFGDIRVNNAIAYISPSFSGLTLAVATVLGAELPNAGGTKGDAWSMAALYGAGSLNVNAAYQEITVGSNGTGGFGLNGVGPFLTNDKTTAAKIGASYALDAFTINAVYEKNGSSGPLGNGLDRSSWYLGGKFSVTSNDIVKAAYAAAGDINSGANTGVKQFSLGYDHNFSKQTTVYALYSKLTNDSAAGYTLGNADSNSNTDATNTSGAGSAPSVFSIGMKHAF